MNSGSASQGADPFEATEENGFRSAPSIRESAVVQAVKFLADPRVQSADHQRAVDFLRKKDLSEAEVREAFRRASIPFPNSSSVPNRVSWADTPSTSNVVMLPPGANLRVDSPRRRGSSWTAVFWGVTVAAGALTVVRELLRRYVAPLYFPEAERRAEERRRRETDQISELRDSMRELVRSSQETNARVERLSATLSSTGMLDDGRTASTSMKQSSGTVATVDGSSRGISERSRGVLERLDELREEVNSLKLLSSGALSNGGGARATGRSSGTSLHNVDEFFTPRQNQTEGVAPSNVGTENVSGVARQLGDELDGSPSTVRSRRSVSFSDTVEKDEKTRLASSARGGVAAPLAPVNPADDDEFMKMEPAHVEKSWSALGRDGTGSASGGSEKASSDIRGVEEAAAPDANDDEARNDVDQPFDVGAITNETGGDGGMSDEVAVLEAKAEQDLKFRKFREAMLAEAELVETQGATGDPNLAPLGGGGLDSNEFVGLSAKDRRISTASAPPPETSLSDVE